MATTWLVLALYALVVARITRLITADKLTEPFRGWVARKFRRDSPAAALDTPRPVHPMTYLVHCAWCTSIWVAAVLCVPAALVADVPLWWAPGLALAASQVTGILSHWDSE